MSNDSRNVSGPQGGKKWIIAILPVILLALVIAIFLGTDGAGLNVEPVVPIENVQFQRTILRDGQIEIDIRNTSPESLKISQININDAIWPFEISQNPIPRLGTAKITLSYPWIEGDPYSITLISGGSVLMDTAIEAATETATATGANFWNLTLVGIYVGIIPVALGMLWLPLLGGLSKAWLKFLMGATVGLLIYLGVDAIAEAWDQAVDLQGPYQGPGIIGLGIILTFALLEAIGVRQKADRSESSRYLNFSIMVAIGIGLHNLGEGMAIGASYAIGLASLGTFLVIGFIIQNVTEGLGIVTPLAKNRPSIGVLIGLAAVAGLPAIVGAWIGGFTSSIPAAVLFMSIGAGAVLQVAWSIGREIVWVPGESAARRKPFVAFGGLATGMVALFLMGILLK